MDEETRPSPEPSPQESGGLEVVARETFHLEGDVSRLVTFLNQALKDQGLIFGLTRTAQGRYGLTIYKT